MGLTSIFRGLFAGKATDSAGGLLRSLFPTGSAPKRGTRELLTAYSKLPYLHAAVRKVSRDVASVPLVLYRPGNGRSKAVAWQVRGAAGEIRRRTVDAMVAAGDLVAVEDHPFLTVLQRWNPALRAHASRFVVAAWRELVGEGFVVKELNGAGLPVELWPVPPSWCIETPTVKRPAYRFASAQWQRVLPEDAVLHMRDVDPAQPYGRGSGSGGALSDELDISQFAAEHIRSFFFNRAMPDVFLYMEGIDSKKQAEEYEERLRAKHQGTGRAHQVHVSSGRMEVKTVGQTFREQEMNGLRLMERDTVLHTIGIPPECLGIIENSNRSTIDASFFLYARGVLCPRLDATIDDLQPEAERFDDGLVLGYCSPVPEDTERQRAHMAQVPTAFTLNEHRAMGGAAPRPDGDAYFKPYAPPAPALPPGGGDGGQEPEPEGEPDEDPDPDEEEDQPEPDDTDSRARAAPGQARVRALSAADLLTVLEALRPEHLTSRLDPIWLEEVRQWGDDALDTLGVDVGFDMRNPLVRAHLEEFSAMRIQGLVNETTREALREALQEGVLAGEDVRRLKARVSDTFAQAQGYRAERIARTEVVGSSNAANLAAFDMSGVVDGKEWLAVQDGPNDAREHEHMDGQRVGLREDFTNPTTGRRAAAPGQFGVAEEDINCRCTVLPVVPEVGKSVDRGAEWRAYDRRLLTWEGRATEALRDGFAEQAADVQAALDRLG